MYLVLGIHILYEGHRPYILEACSQTGSRNPEDSPLMRMSVTACHIVAKFSFNIIGQASSDEENRSKGCSSFPASQHIDRWILPFAEAIGCLSPTPSHLVSRCVGCGSVGAKSTMNGRLGPARQSSDRRQCEDLLGR